MRSLISWKDHVVEKPGVFAESDAGNGNVKLDPRFGEVIQQGTPQNATNFNIMDLAAFEAMLMANENARQIRFLMDSMGAVEGLKIPVTLKNTYDYPFNNSNTTVQITPSRNTTDYTVEVELVSETGGSHGEFVVTDKLVNGFKLAYTGSAKSVSVNVYVRGGV